ARRAWSQALASGEWNDWSWQHRARLTSVDAVLDVLGEEFPIASSVRAAMRGAAAASRVSVTPYYLALADPSDPRDPILPQVLPDPAEAEGDGEPDPFHEEELQIAPGVVHRYPDRALFLLTNFCTTLCRHCMRKREWQRRFERLSDAQADDA